MIWTDKGISQRTARHFHKRLLLYLDTYRNNVAVVHLPLRLLVAKVYVRWVGALGSARLS